MAFSQDNARLVAGFSSIAQMGFVLLGIFALRTDGLDGAVLQMVNHGLVVVPMMLIIAFLADRVRSDDLSKMGGLAFRAPFLAAIFLVVTMAVLALPGSANFVGEFYVLRGAFEVDIALAVIASLGVAMAGFYALRLYQLSMHNREVEADASAEISTGRGAILGVLVAVIVALALYPQLILERVDDSAESHIAAAAKSAGQTPVTEASVGGRP
jgi:NADH-quinone oxidoreductase subunit M